MDDRVKKQIQAEAAHKERVLRIQLMRRVFATPDGERVLAILERLTHGVLRPSPGAPIDPLQLALLQGRRDVVEFIRDYVAASEKEGNADA